MLDEDLEKESSLPLFAKDKALGWLLVVGGIVSWLASVVLILDRIKIYEDPSAIVSCDLNAWIACGEVMRTPQAAIFGFPNPFIGLAAFAVIITIGSILAAGVKLPKRFWIALQTGLTLGIALVGWFWFTALYTIGVLCPYCMAVWAMMIPMFIWTTTRNILSGTIPSPSWLKRVASVGTTPVIIGVYLFILSSIIQRFGSLIFGGIS